LEKILESIVFSFFKRPAAREVMPLQLDAHSHLLPQLDDGVQSLEEAKQVIDQLLRLGISKVITTPHIHEAYRNSGETILPTLDLLKTYLEKEGSEMTIEAAAEYYFDEVMMAKLDKNEKLLTFDANYLLFETNYLTEPYNLKEFIFKSTTQGYRLILAHPERYQYMTMEKAEDLKDRGVLLQVNMLSLIGFYSKPIQSMAYKLIDKGWVDMLGSDCHNLLQAQLLKEVFKNKYFKKALDLNLLNHTLAK
jgi:protein-tyrosine phosphatase